MVPKYVTGGIGDCLLSLDSAISEKQIEIYSHFKEAPDIFIPFGVEISRFEYYESLEELRDIFISGLPLERKKYLQCELPKPYLKKKDNSKIIGIHVEGSALSNNYWRERGKPTKEMSQRFFSELINKIQEKYPNVIFYLFCGPSRLQELGKIAAEIVKEDFYIIAFPKIWDSLSCVQNCDVVIGVDSAIKTMSSILKIPTITLVGHYQDIFRDENFLRPYIEDGIMNVVSVANIETVKASDVLQYISL